MQLVCISRGSLSGGRDVASALAGKLGAALLSREDVIEAATRAGIQVGKLETSMMRGRAFSERLARERDHYLAFSTVMVCEQALRGPLVYHGRSGHLLLRGVSHVLRIRVVADQEYRIRAAMHALSVDRTRAERYLADVEEDRRNWVRAMYGVSWEDAREYDMVVNVANMSPGNAASGLVSLAQLPDFQITPASRHAIDELLLSARARLLLARDARTAAASLSVTTHADVVTVTYLPRDMEVASEVPRVLASLEGAADIRTTMAATNILWVQEAFDPASETFREVAQIAGKYGAAVELVRYLPQAEDGSPPTETALRTDAAVIEGGIEEDAEDAAGAAGAEGGLKISIDELARLGCSGGGRQVEGGRGYLMATCCNTIPYSLVVLGNLFLEKGAAARVRLTRELQDSIERRLRVPVVTAEELRTRYFFGIRDLLRVAAFLVVVAAAYLAVFGNQEPVLRFLTGEWGGGGALVKLAVAAAVFAFTPIVAFTYGGVVRAAMKLIRME